MQRSCVLFLAAVLVAGFASAQEFVIGEVLVRFQPATTAARIAEIEHEYSLTLIRKYSLMQILCVTIYRGMP